jgi:hypothetical protein
MFSEMTVIPGLVNGILGMELDVPQRVLRLAPHLPPTWPEVALRRFPYGTRTLALRLRQSNSALTADVESTGTEAIEVDFAPALPAGSTVSAVLQDGKPVRFDVEARESDVHARARVTFAEKTRLEVRFRPGVAIEVARLPLFEGDTSRNLRVLKTSYRTPRLEMVVEGRPGQSYPVRLHTPWRPRRAEGAGIERIEPDLVHLLLSAPAELRSQPDRAGYVRWTVRVEFGL